MGLRKLILRMDISEQAASETGGELFKAFCKCYRKENSFTVTDKELSLEVFFEKEPDAEIIEAIGKLHFEYIRELRFSETDDNAEDDVEKSSMNIVTEKKNSTLEQEEPSDTPNTSVKEESRQTKAKKVPAIDEAGKEILDKIRSEASSFDDFVQRVMDFLEIGEHYRGFFTCVIEAASKVSALSWNEIQKVMVEDEQDFSTSKKVALMNAVKTKFDEKGSRSRALTIIFEMIKYRNFNFESQHDGLNHDKTSKELEIEKPKYTVLSDELVKEALKRSSYFDRVGCIFDRIRTDRFDDDTYSDYRSRIVDTLVSAAADNSENPQMSANDCVFFFIGKNFSSSQAHVVRAMVFQSIKDYARSRGYEGNAYTQHFLKDLRMLL